MHRDIVIEKYGPASTLHLRDLVPRDPADDEVAIDVAYSGVNFADIQTRRGGYHDTRQPPFTPGLEMAGTVDALGAGVTGFQIGQRVASHADGGSYAEYGISRAVGVL